MGVRCLETMDLRTVRGAVFDLEENSHADKMINLQGACISECGHCVHVIIEN